MNKLNKQLITLFGLTASIIAMILINTTIIDPSKYQNASTTKERMKIFVDNTADRISSSSDKVFKIVTFNKFSGDDNTTIGMMDNNDTNITKVSTTDTNLSRISIIEKIKSDINATIVVDSNISEPVKMVKEKDKTKNVDQILGVFKKPINKKDI